MAQVDVHVPVGAAGEQSGAGVPGQQVEGVGQGKRPVKIALRRDEFSRLGRRGRLRAPLREGVFPVWCAEGIRRVTNGAVAGAAAEVAAQGVQVEAVGGAVLLGGALAVVLGGHARHEAGGAVAALRAAAPGEFALHRVEVRRRTEPLGGHDFLPAECCQRDEAGVDAFPAGACALAVRCAFPVRPGDEHRAGAAFALGAAFLAAGQALVAQPMQQRGVGGHVPDPPRGAVDGQLECVHGPPLIGREKKKDGPSGGFSMRPGPGVGAGAWLTHEADRWLSMQNRGLVVVG